MHGVCCRGTAPLTLRDSSGWEKSLHKEEQRRPLLEHQDGLLEGLWGGEVEEQ